MINYRYVANQLGLLLLVLSLVFAVTGGFALHQMLFFDGGDNERASFYALLSSTGIGLLLGGALYGGTRGGSKKLGRREALLLVTVSWIVGGLLSGLPYWLWAHLAATPLDQPMRNPINCWFESISGLTTTGATILSAIQELPPSMLLWRSLTHWLGGLGIVVLFVAVLPSLGTGGKQLFRVESSGLRSDGVRPQIRETSRILWLVYLGLTAACFLGFLAFGMSWFDAMNHAFSTMSTGGFSTRDASIGHYDNLGITMIATIFMIAAGINFTLFYYMVQGRWKLVRQDVEFRVYMWSKLVLLVLIVPFVIGSAIVMTDGRTVPGNFIQSTVQSLFTIASLQTGTGFGANDFTQFPFFVNALLFGLLFIGGCAGSTAGGVKVVRFWLTLKVLIAQIEKAFRPDVVRPVRLGKATIDNDFIVGSVTFVASFMVLVFAGAMVIRLIEGGDGRCDTVTCFTASLASLANVGPGLGNVGPTENFGWFSDSSKLVFSLLMILGRLELFAILVLFTPRFWRQS